MADVVEKALPVFCERKYEAEVVEKDEVTNPMSLTKLESATVEDAETAPEELARRKPCEEPT